VVVLLGAGLVAWFVVRKRGEGFQLPGGRELQVIGTTRVGGRWLVALVRVPGRTLVVGASEKGLSLLSEIRDEGDDQLDALPEGLSRQLVDAKALLGASGAAETAGRGGRASAAAGAPFESLLSEMIRNNPGAVPTGSDSARGGQSPLESPEARALRARLQRQQPMP
jgi:flagellar biogenesis protein FliO